MKIKKVDDKPMVIHTKEKTKIHSHQAKQALSLEKSGFETILKLLYFVTVSRIFTEGGYMGGYIKRARVGTFLLGFFAGGVYIF